MKKILDSKFLFIVALSLIVLIVLGIGSFYLFNNNDDVFVRDGYVLNPLSAKVEKYFFNEETGYRENLSQMIEFKDVDNNDVTVLKDSFLHYMDGSLSFLKNGAILDLGSIKGSNAVDFYNITSKSIIEKNGNIYVIKNSGDDIKFDNLIGRISDNKYIVVGTLEAKIPGNNANIKGDYFEIAYTEEGIVNIENKDAKYQVTAEGSYIYAGDTVIDLGKKKITKNGEDVMSITAITINGNENIEIIPADKEKEDNTGNGNNAGNENGNNNQTTPTQNDNQGGNDITGNNNQTDDSNVSDEAVISLKDANVGSTSVDLSFDIANQAADDSFTLKVTNLDSGRTVDIFENVKADEEIRVNLLSPNTKYLFTVVNERDEGKYFQKIFETTGFGISLEKNYVTDSTISYVIKVDDNTDITNAKLSLYKFNEETNKNEIVKTSYVDAETGEIKYIEKTVELSSLSGNIAGTHEVIFDSLDSNTVYTAVLDEFSVVSSNFRDIYNIALTNLTLKKTPSFGDMIVNKDISNNSFKLSLGNINDPDNAIVGYTYLIYEYGNDSNTVVPPITRTSASAIEVKVGDGENELKNDTNYYYKAVIEYFDNEKNIEYITTDSINFIMGTEPYITVIPDQNKISFDKIGATIYLIDNGCLISMPGREKCAGESTAIVDVSRINPITGEKISVFSKLVEFTVSENEIKYDLTVDNLQAGTAYSISVMAVRSDLDTERVEILHTEESKKIITTKSLSTFVTEWTNQDSNANHVVNLKSKFVGEDGSGTMTPSETAAAINKVVIKLYNGEFLNDLQSQQPIATKTFTNTDEFNIKEQFYDTAYTITTDETFGLDLEGLKSLGVNGKLSEFYTIAISAYFDSEEKNEVRLTNNVTTYKISPVLLMENVSDPQIFIEKISKRESGITNNLIDDGTTVGYKVTAAFDRNGLVEHQLNPQKINLFVLDQNGTHVKFYVMDNNGNLTLTDKVSAAIGENNYFESKIYMDYGSEYDTVDINMARGNKYYVGYELELSTSNGLERYPTNVNEEVNANYGVYKDVISEKETPTLKMYIAKSTANSITYRYKMVDPDNALYREDSNASFGFYYIVNDGSEHKLNITKIEDTVKTFSGDITINDLNKNDVYQIYYKKNATKTGSIENDVLNYFDGAGNGKRLFDGYYDATQDEYNFKYEIINNPLSDNKVTIKILASDSIIDRILSYRISFKDSKGNVLNKELWKLSACDMQENSPVRCFTVDYIELKRAGMKSDINSENPIKVTVDAIYDNGLTGYDFTVGNDKDYKYMIMQDNNTETEYGKYIVFSSRGQLTNWTNTIDMPKGYYTYSASDSRITYNSALNASHTANITYTVTSTGYTTSFGVMNPKMVSVNSMSTDNDTFSFSSITPKIGINSTTRLINGALVNMALSGADIGDFCEENNGNNCVNTANGNKYLYVNVWDNENDIGDFDKQAIPTVKVLLNNNNPQEEVKAAITNLNNSKTYYYQVYAYLNKNDRSVYTQLFDVGYTDRYQTKTYNFQSLGSSDIMDAESIGISYKYIEDGEYNDKTLDTKFTLIPYNGGAPFNYDINYAFCLIDDDTCGIGENETNIFKRSVNMDELKATFVDSQDITEFDLEYDKNYKIFVYATFDVYDKENGELTKKNLLLNRRNYSVNLKKLDTPDFVVGREAVYVNGEYAIDFSINVKDTDRTLKNGEYFVKLVDGSGNVVGDLQVKDQDNNYVTVASNGNYTDYTLDATVSNKNIRITGLNENTKYSIVVYSNAYLNNYSETVPKDERTVVVEKSHTVYSTNRSGVAFGKDIIFSATERSIVTIFLGGSNFDNVQEVNYTIGLWDNDEGNATYSGSYNLKESSKKFEMYKDTDDWRFVIDPDGMVNVLGQTYTVALSFSVYNAETDSIDYYDSVTNPEFAGRVQYVKDNTK